MCKIEEARGRADRMRVSKDAEDRGDDNETARPSSALILAEKGETVGGGRKIWPHPILV